MDPGQAGREVSGTQQLARNPVTLNRPRPYRQFSFR